MYRLTLALYRICYFLHKKRVPLLPWILNQLFLRVMLSVQISNGAKIGKGVIFSYGGLGVVINSGCIIEDNVKIGTGVLLGGRELAPGRVPIIKKNSIISTGAKILGAIVVGENSVVGANSVVIEDVPPNSIVAGVPAKVIKSDIDISCYRNDLDGRAE